MTAEYRFVPITPEDYPMLRGWLSQPHIDGWWGPPDHEIALIEGDRAARKTDMRIVWADRPFAYVQDWDVHQEGVPQFADQPRGTRAMDTFLGDPAYLGQGHAARYLRARALQLLAAGAPVVGVDPDPANLRAIAAYERAGFAGDRVVPCEDGDPVRVMIFQGEKAPGKDVR